ncbi:hypothetical protein SEA_REDFOX_10 [Arthrobacter phage RedFox]|nr:hypothetical protein SEA_REDFOX_10 [Arthrobacter phage RedFox]
MASKVTRIVFNYAAFNRVRKDGAVVADLAARGRAIADAAGEGVGVQTSVGATRARVVVATETRAAAEREARDKTLTAAIGAGRG